MSVSAVRARRIPVQLLPRSLRNHQPRLGRTDRDNLGERLRGMYEALRDEPLPERLQDVVNRLARSASASQSNALNDPV